MATIWKTNAARNAVRCLSQSLASTSRTPSIPSRTPSIPSHFSSVRYLRTGRDPSSRLVFLLLGFAVEQFFFLFFFSFLMLRCGWIGHMRLFHRWIGGFGLCRRRGRLWLNDSGSTLSLFHLESIFWFLLLIVSLMCIPSRRRLLTSLIRVQLPGTMSPSSSMVCFTSRFLVFLFGVLYKVFFLSMYSVSVFEWSVVVNYFLLNISMSSSFSFYKSWF